MSEKDNSPGGGPMEHLDEMTCMLYVERQLDRARAQEVSAHAQECGTCRTLLRAMERESRLLTRAMLEEEEALPARLARFQERARRSMQWVWGLAFGLAASGVYALYTGYVEPWQNQLEQAGFGGTNLLSMLIFQGAFWKGWQSMITLLEVLALLTAAGVALAFFRRRLRRGSAVALVLAGFCGFAALAAPPAALASEFRKGQTAEVGKDEVIKGDVYMSGERVRVDGTVDGDVYAAGKEIEINGHVLGDVIAVEHTLWVRGQVEGNVRSAGNTMLIAGTVGKNVSWFGDTVGIDSTGKVGGSLMFFGSYLNLDGQLGRDLLLFGENTTISGLVGGEIRAKGDRLTITANAKVGGPIRFEGNYPPEVAAGAKLASPVDYHKMEHRPRYRQGHYYVWRVIWTAAYILFGLVLCLLAPKFAGETVAAAEKYGAPIGLGVLVLFGLPIAAVIACITVVGIPLGILALAFWVLMLCCAELAVGAVIGNWILGSPRDTWDLIGRMALGVVIVRIVYTPLQQLHVLGLLVGLGIWVWGIGAISLALYRRFDSGAGTGSGPVAPMPVSPGSTIGGAQPA